MVALLGLTIEFLKDQMMGHSKVIVMVRRSELQLVIEMDGLKETSSET